MFLSFVDPIKQGILSVEEDSVFVLLHPICLKVSVGVDDPKINLPSINLIETSSHNILPK